MRAAEAKTNPEPYRGTQGGGVEVPISLGRGRIALAVGTLASALLACAPAQAQSTVEIEDRIEATFDLILGNTAELAVPLTRRALARRFDDSEGIEPLSYAAAEPEAEPPTEIATAEVEEGSAEDDSDVARLPRPRPDEASETTVLGATASSDLIGRPLDLVAGAAVPEPAEVIVTRIGPSPPLAETTGPATTVTAETTASLIVPTAAAPSAPELVATEACLSVDDVADDDRDFKRNADVLSGAGFCIAEERFKERRRPWIIQTVKSRQPGPLWAVMHDDENTSFDTAVQALRSHGGTLVAIEADGKRNLSGVDPNRNFSGDGIGCSKLGNDAAPRFTKFIRELIDPAQPIVALHNNAKDHIHTGGLGHVSMDQVPKGMRASPAPDAGGPLAGDRALVLFAVADLDDPTAASRTAILNGKGVNVVLEEVKKGDCSLSNFAVLIDNPNYFNVTVDAEEGEKQMRIVDILMSGYSETVASQ